MTIFALILISSTVFVIRGPLRALGGGGGDFAAPYVATARFISGVNPYPYANFIQQWHVLGAPDGVVLDTSGQRPIYPPTTLAVMMPFGSLGWVNGLRAYTFICSLSYAYLVYLLAATIGQSWVSWKRATFIFFCFALSPVHTGIAVANLSVLTFIICLYCLELARRNRDLQSGLLLGIAICLKPTTGILVVLYFLCAKRFKLVATTFSFALLTASIVLWRLFTIAPDWQIAYRENLSYLFGPNGAANFATQNTTRFDLINLQVPFYELFHNISFANTLSWLVVAIVFGYWLTLIGRFPRLLRSQESVAAILLIGLLPIYQRNYNAGFIIVALAWAFENIHRSSARAIVGLGIIFLIPGEGLLRTFDEQLPVEFTKSFLWHFAVMPQMTWGILSIILILLHVMSRSRVATAADRMSSRETRYD